jgi:hypothetical protein
MKGICLHKNSDKHEVRSQNRDLIQNSTDQQGQKWQLFLPTSGLVFAFCVFATVKRRELVLEANSLFDCCNDTERNYTKPEVIKIIATIAIADLLTFE